MSAGWSDEETLKLIELWGDDRVQAELEGCKRNKQVYERVSREMVRAGHKRTAEQCRDKAKKLKGDYRKVKDTHNKTGEGRKKWKFLEAMDAVLADKPSTQPPVLIDTLIVEKQVEPEKKSKEDSVNKGESPASSGSPSGSEVNKQQASESSKSEGQTKEAKQSGPEQEKGKKDDEKDKKKSKKEEKLTNAMMTVVDRLISSQQSSDNRFIELEEKRMKFEEKMLDMEERQRREEREFRQYQLHMWMTMQGVQTPPVHLGMHGSRHPPSISHGRQHSASASPIFGSSQSSASSPHEYGFNTSYDDTEHDLM